MDATATKLVDASSRKVDGTNDSMLGSFNSGQWSALLASVVVTEDRVRAGDPNDETMHAKKKLPSVIYETPTRGISNARREISHASLGRLVAKLTDAHHYDTEFRDGFLLTYRCHSTAYEFVKKLIKRYKAAMKLMNPSSIECDPTNADEERFSIPSNEAIDVNTQAEANISIMRAMSVLKFWIRESGYIEADLSDDRKAQKKLFLFLEDIRKTSPIPSIVRHAETMLHVVGKILKASTMLRQQLKHHETPQQGSRPYDMPSPLDLGNEDDGVSMAVDALSRSAPAPASTSGAPMLTRSSSDSTKEPSTKVPTLARGMTTGSSQYGVDAAMLLSSASSHSSSFGPLTRSQSDSTREKGKYMSVSRSEPLSGISAQEAAEQLTLLEEYRYLKIQPRELTNKNWTSANKHMDSPNVLALIELFDARAGWVSSEILHPKLQAKQRAKMIAYFIDVAEACHQLHNFNTLFEVITGLKAPCIQQLKTTWDLLPQAQNDRFECLKNICAQDNNYATYRQAFALAEESMPTIEHGLICFQKFRKIHRAIVDALSCQNVRYTSTTTVGRRRKALVPEKNQQMMLRHRLETIRKPSAELFRLAKNANRQENVLFVNSLADAGFM
ncbi:hypothetical protein SPRG_19011 [Saprolegnia parasitica CBS 223.65]|uniref:Ras-GEF domain-containing protein n=1 Tax=Saprolegnia parasitica (strain CBS 223.65) TaxID=695850 RepID=A0A067D651_SAPPC|nr:hypothetical protein SPRG_19011 [Saprolegnia parasitica CBS 223.65]KDO34156.1 hypothetical protein SPRG_19011 [Saprolegnia parasitica CBS 223.65]|eukprot:XP_012195210.1 hypothetical protein SPRG_19011 [Saprolegnia parasitica CBS 223.65]